MRHRRHVIIGAVVLTMLAGWSVRQLPLATLGAQVADANRWWLVVGVIAHMTIQLVASAQWWWLLPAARWTAVFRVFSIGSVANNTANALVGHAAGTAMIAALPGVGVPRALTMLALDQLCVGLAKLVVLFTALQLAADASAVDDLPRWISSGLRGVLLAVGVLALLVVAVARLVPMRRLPPLLHTTVTAIRAVPLLHLAAAAACALLVKGCEAAGIAAVQVAFGVALTPASVLLVLAATTVATFVPVMPANLGTYEAAVYAALVALGVSVETALAMAVVQHVVQLTAAVVPGVVVSWRRVVGGRAGSLN